MHEILKMHRQWHLFFLLWRVVHETIEFYMAENSSPSATMEPVINHSEYKLIILKAHQNQLITVTS